MIMSLQSISCLAVASLLVLAGLAVVVSAQDSPAPAAQPTEEKDCVVDTSSFRQDGRTPAFVIELTNTCEKRLKCEVSAFVQTAKGQNSGESILFLAPKSEGAASRQTYAIPLRQASGAAHSSHECNEL
jgi:hypothetical protein